MFDVAFATYVGSPEMTPDDRLVADALRAKGVGVRSAVWNAAGIDWSQFDAVVIRSTWDYHLAPERYGDWLRSFPRGGGRLWNPPEAVLQNLNKRYLCGLASRAVEVVPTIYVHASDGVRLRELLEDRGWGEAVIKPAVSANARGTWRTALSTAAADQARFAGQLRGQDLLVQPFLPEVIQGEWSFIFFGGRYSHAVLKRPAAGDFRVQRDFGGHSVPAIPAATLIEQAALVLSAADQPLLYARVDGIEREGRLVLMELEINEPYLFIGSSDGAAGRFADAIMHILAAAAERTRGSDSSRDATESPIRFPDSSDGR
jgi:glutathione synthase/RimK-type ligase-like ATP-grasp enzyme